MKDPNKVAEGKRYRLKGATFERKVRRDLEAKGWIVDKWTNNVEFLCDTKHGMIHPAKSFRGITRSNGFPDFIAFKLFGRTDVTLYEVIAVESKMNGIISKQEKEKCQWYLDNNIFSKILIASKDDKNIVYKEFERGLKK